MQRQFLSNHDGLHSMANILMQHTASMTITCIPFLATLDLLDKDSEEGIMRGVPLLNKVFKPADHLYIKRL